MRTEWQEFWIIQLTKLVLSAVVAVLIYYLDHVLTPVDLPLWLCIVIALVLVFGGWLIIVHVRDYES